MSVTYKPPFYLFGMGNREKFVYKNGQLIAYPSMQVVFSCTVIDEQIIPEDYTVRLTTTQGKVVIEENEQGVYLNEGDTCVCLTEGYMHLPSFEQYQYQKALRILHHEICINIIDGKPVPNIFVYDKPWYRDSAMMLIALELTDNIHLISDWAKSISECYDRNNAGNQESDNLGQVLYILAKTGNNDHQIIPTVISEAKKLVQDGVLTGTTDFDHHPVYQTKWLKLGLDALGLDSSWLKIPDVHDYYSELFWMDGHKSTDNKYEFDDNYPYLSWARLHSAQAPLTGRFLEAAELAQYPMTSETNASQADYQKQRVLFEQLAERHCAAPHSWHAAEMFLYLIKFKKEGY